MMMMMTTTMSEFCCALFTFIRYQHASNTHLTQSLSGSLRSALDLDLELGFDLDGADDVDDDDIE